MMGCMKSNDWVSDGQWWSVWELMIKCLEENDGESGIKWWSVWKKMMKYLEENFGVSNISVWSIPKGSAICNMQYCSSEGMLSERICYIIIWTICVNHIISHVTTELLHRRHLPCQFVYGHVVKVPPIRAEKVFNDIAISDGIWSCSLRWNKIGSLGLQIGCRSGFHLLLYCKTFDVLLCIIFLHMDNVNPVILDHCYPL